ncbi:MAG: type II toxin-antitoxin system PemK/MazF family toxin [Candidatus Solibacter usitatus]|nr:type II toxin-antitoxin system PemK/MazF family toxin [Candidatus Solibacter usitatus]
MEKTRRTTPGKETSHPRRGEIYLTALDPTQGREIKKTRPVLIIQNDVSNRLSDITIVAPITSTVRFPLNPVHVLLEANLATGLTVTSVAMLNQVRAVDRLCLIRRLGVVDDATLELVNEAIKISFGLIHF